MSRSYKKTLTLPHPIHDALGMQVEQGVIDYPSLNAAHVGLARYQLMVGQPHFITSAIARMHPEEQDIIDDFLMALTERQLNVRGSFLKAITKRLIDGKEDPNPDEIISLQASEVLALAKRAAAGDETVWEYLESIVG